MSNPLLRVVGSTASTTRFLPGSPLLITAPSDIYDSPMTTFQQANLYRSPELPRRVARVGEHSDQRSEGDVTTEDFIRERGLHVG
ncbi:uncharacterized protein N7469_002270 [Penicillium citrinum]|uniref:Uncharacterized protein n=2 Tax=Penicillium TaxID=5073 RepID=A0A9W9PC94_PENCI|nr:uncharacterized protein N7469_002204 [Penicillium citrinum]XP_056503684.1 uncharacterized protein N7469_002270 [Penicillium citrinum]KAJ5240613.1 hypothetical protein N7469_002204 [Penicillium citrinum]KAJ5240679.1 hypothetical protein N7469_002270 [Penicillium citrinum]KAJ5569028.1 hypothetical protein N7450_011514 [Penicillium hetheringtonii]